MTKIYSLLGIISLLISCESNSFIDLEKLENRKNQETNFSFGSNCSKKF